MVSIGERTTALNRLLRGELAAVETYSQALEKIGNSGGALELMRVQQEHEDAAEILRQHVAERGAVPEFSSGAWGAFAKTVEGVAKIFGESSALKALKEGEEHGIKEYETALLDENLDLECRMLIGSTLLPRQRTHLRTLKSLLAAS